MAKRLKVTYKRSERDGTAPIKTHVEYIENQLHETVEHSYPFGTRVDTYDWEWDDCPHCVVAGTKFQRTHLVHRKTDECIVRLMRKNGHKLQPEKDAMQTKVYRIEHTLREQSQYQFKTGDWTGVRKFYKELYSQLRLDKSQLLLNLMEAGVGNGISGSDRTWARRVMKGELPQLTWTTGQSADAWQFQWRIRLPKAKWAWNGLVLLHEFAHLISPSASSHDGIFVRTFVDLVKLMESKELSDKLERMFVSGTKIDYKKWVLTRLQTDRGVHYKNVLESNVKKVQVDIASPIHGLARFRAPNKFGWSFFEAPPVMIEGIK